MTTGWNERADTAATPTGEAIDSLRASGFDLRRNRKGQLSGTSIIVQALHESGGEMPYDALKGVFDAKATSPHANFSTIASQAIQRGIVKRHGRHPNVRFTLLPPNGKPMNGHGEALAVRPPSTGIPVPLVDAPAAVADGETSEPLTALVNSAMETGMLLERCRHRQQGGAAMAAMVMQHFTKGK